MIIILSILLLLLFLFLLWLLLICPSDSYDELTAPFLGHAIAHRGLHDQMEQAPENSLHAFRLAIQHGYGIELDITLSKDGQVIVFHDNTLTRICGVEGNVEDFTYEELRKYPLHHTEEHIPLFSDVLALVAGKVPLIVEFKHCSRNAELVEKGLALLDTYPGPYCAESFDPFLMARIRRARPKLFRGQLSCRHSKIKNRFLEFASANLLFNFISRPHFIAYRHEDRRNLSYRAAVKLLHAIPVSWTVRTEAEFYQLFDEGVDIQIFEGFLPPAILEEGDPDSDIDASSTILNSNTKEDT